MDSWRAVLCAVLSLLAFFCTQSLSISWSSTSLAADESLYACPGQSLSFPWQVTLTTGETVTGVEWFYDGQSQEIVAVLSHGSFVPLPSFSGRVELTANEGLVLHHVTALDSGNYSVRFTAQLTNGSVAFLQRTALVYITDSLLARDGHLHVHMVSEAKYDNCSQQWRAVLTCGVFLSTSRPLSMSCGRPHKMEPRPARDTNTGTFFSICRHDRLVGPTPAPSLPSPCRPARGWEGGGGAGGGGQDRARMILLEAQQNALVAENAKLKHQNDVMAERLNEVQRGSEVSFHARLHTSVHLPTWTRLVMSDIISNHGDAYSAATGEVQRPYEGTYFFMATTTVFGINHVANFFLMVGDREVDYAYTSSWTSGHSEGGSVHAVVALTTGQRVWLRSYQNSYYLDGATAFSGFLIHRHG